MNSNLKVGAGEAVIEYSDDMFPTSEENYIGVHDDTYVQVIAIEAQRLIAIVCVETVILYEKLVIAQEVASVLGTSASKVVVQAKHITGTPHARRKAGDEKGALICDAMIKASVKAAEIAKANIQNAVMRYSTGVTDIICNRLVYTKEGWWQGHNPDIQADGLLPVIRFDDMNGNPIAILFNCNTAPGVMENSFLEAGGRLVTGDIASETERMIKSQYNGVVAAYLTGVTGDHWTSLRSLLDHVDINGTQIVEDLHEQGFIFVKVLAERLCEAVIKACENSEVCEVDERVNVDMYAFDYPAQIVEGGKNMPRNECVYTNNGVRDMGLKVISIGNTAILAVGVELGSRTWKKILEQSPFDHNLIMEFAHEDGNGYMMESDYYDMVTYQSQKSKYAKGSAEKFAEDAIRSLKQSWIKRNSCL